MANRKFRFDFWFLVLLGAFGAIALFLIYPLSSLFISGFQNPETGGFSLMHFQRFANQRFFYTTLQRSMTVSVWTMTLSVVLGVTMAYLTTAFRIRGKKVLDILIIISMLSPPFLGAYSWILLAGRNGALARFARDNFGMTLPNIYGFGGILLVMTLSTFPLVYLFTRGALRKVDASLIEASESLGCSPLKKVATLIIPLITPSILAAALLAFMDAFTDFGTPMLLGQGYMVMPVLIFNEFLSEIGGHPNFAAAMAMIMVAVTALLFTLQKYIVNRRSYKMSSMRPIVAKKLKGASNVVAHIFVYAVVGLVSIPQTIVIYTSFRRTSGPIFVDGLSLDSYRRIFRTLGTAIRNTYVYGLIAVGIILVISLLLAYLSVRRKSLLTSILDTVAMLPFVIPGSVIGIILILAFNTPPILLIGTSYIMILAFVIRRLPYTLRSSSAILHQINPNMEEAAISLGDTPGKAFLKITAILMLPGVISGLILSWITIINEVSATILLFTTRTRTMTVAIFHEIMRDGLGAAAALATILTASTIISLILFFKLTGKTEINF
ncbi:MAG: iron ABC transporter permease [Defluviitaleaceae bacterium]|nr:iron ABC transporter permease [Defluviitaleaceae bacterium]